jgi:hypothetical protein
MGPMILDLPGVQSSKIETIILQEFLKGVQGFIPLTIILNKLPY